MSNLYSSLNRYLIRQPENFLTESLAHLLNEIANRESETFADLVDRVAGQHLKVRSNSLSIGTQETLPKGRPDLVIRQSTDFVLFIEIKHDSPLGLEQLERYHSELMNQDGEIKQLVLLTRSKHSLTQSNLDTTLYRHICWYELAAWISEASIKDPVVEYLITSFLQFLEEKEMATEKVEWQYMDGVPALRRLLVMLSTSLAEAFPDKSATRNAGWNWIGYIVAEKYWVGIRYEHSLQISIEKPGKVAYEPLKILDLQKSHFFALDAGEQLDQLIHFISKGMKDLN